jgi:hypothetical protein
MSRTTHQRRAVAGLVALLLLGLAAPQAQAASRTNTQITGTITLNGCVLRPAGVVLRAQYLTVGAPGEEAGRPRPDLSRTARLFETSDPHVLGFTVSDLQPGRIYHLAVRDADTLRGVDFGRCGRLFWRGPFEGLAAPGSPAVALEAFAARTQVEVLRGGDDTWNGADDLDFDDSASFIRSIRWRTSVADAIGGELQISTEPFAGVGPRGNSCAEPEEGIVYRQQVPASRGGWVQLDPLNLRQALLPRDTRVDDPGASQPSAATAPNTAPMTAAKLTALVQGAPLWIRVVPRRASGLVCDARRDGVHGWLNLASVLASIVDAPNEEPPDPHLTIGGSNAYAAPYFDAEGRPSGDQSAFVAVRTHLLPTYDQSLSLKYFFSDPLAAVFVNQNPWWGGRWVGPGTDFPGFYLVVDPGEPSWWDDVTDSLGSLVTGAIDAVGFLVDKVSAMYAEIKAAAIKVALSTIHAVEPFSTLCSGAAEEACRKAVEYGVDAGLAAVGMPPSLPNWNELQEMGVDYLAAELASQAGLPPEATEFAIHALADEAMQELSANRGGKGLVFNWLLPYYGTDPATLTLSLHRDGDLPSGLLFQRGANELFLGDFVAIPPRWTSDDLLVPMVLQPDVSSVPAPVCYSYVFVVQQVPCNSGYKARWYRNHFRTAWEQSTCVNLNSRVRQLRVNNLYDYDIVDLPGSLAPIAFATVNPQFDHQWSGKFSPPC